MTTYNVLCLIMLLAYVNTGAKEIFAKYRTRELISKAYYSYHDDLNFNYLMVALTSILKYNKLLLAKRMELLYNTHF